MAQGSLPSDSQKVWLITGKLSWSSLSFIYSHPSYLLGASSGIGKRLLLSAFKRGDFVIGTSRSSKVPADFPQSPRIRHVVLDLDMSTAEITKSVDEAIKIWGRIDVLVNNAGSVLPAMLEEGGSTMLHRQMQTNLYGMLDVTNAVLPQMRARMSGTVLFQGSRSSWRTDVPVRDPFLSFIYHELKQCSLFTGSWYAIFPRNSKSL